MRCNRAWGTCYDSYYGPQPHVCGAEHGHRRAHKCERQDCREELALTKSLEERLGGLESALLKAKTCGRCGGAIARAPVEHEAYSHIGGAPADRHHPWPAEPDQKASNWQHVAVVQGDQGKQYEIKRHPNGQLGCSCTAYRFSSPKGCKHIDDYSEDFEKARPPPPKKCSAYPDEEVLGLDDPYLQSLGSHGHPGKHDGPAQGCGQPLVDKALPGKPCVACDTGMHEQCEMEESSTPCRNCSVCDSPSQKATSGATHEFESCKDQQGTCRKGCKHIDDYTDDFEKARDIPEAARLAEQRGDPHADWPREKADMACSVCGGKALRGFGGGLTHASLSDVELGHTPPEPAQKASSPGLAPTIEERLKRICAAVGAAEPEQKADYTHQLPVHLRAAVAERGARYGRPSISDDEARDAGSLAAARWATSKLPEHDPRFGEEARTEAAGEAIRSLPKALPPGITQFCPICSGKGGNHAHWCRDEDPDTNPLTGIKPSGTKTRCDSCDASVDEAALGAHQRLCKAPIETRMDALLKDDLEQRVGAAVEEFIGEDGYCDACDRTSDKCVCAQKADPRHALPGGTHTLTAEQRGSAAYQGAMRGKPESIQPPAYQGGSPWSNEAAQARTSAEYRAAGQRASSGAATKPDYELEGQVGPGALWGGKHPGVHDVAAQELARRGKGPVGEAIRSLPKADLTKADSCDECGWYKGCGISHKKAHELEFGA